jgi:uncharacterized repeat protein (TIGR03803 family)
MLLMRLLWFGAIMLTLVGAKADVAFTSLYSFNVFTNGSDPNALTKGIDGTFYGTTSGGGRYGVGTVFKITTNGQFSSLNFFTGGNDGAYPSGSLVQGSDGDFYGTAGSGGTNGYGVVFRIKANGAITGLYSFTGGDDGASPYAGVVQGSNGIFYGTTYDGGTYGFGGVFKITTNGVFTRLYSFTGGNDGANPDAGLVEGSDGNFYGTTSGGGLVNTGVVFKITADGVFTRLHSFTGGDDGAAPQAGLLPGSDGYLYGTAREGGTDGAGTVFKITTGGAFNRLYSFTGGKDGGQPTADLVQGNDGNFYGTTLYGGTNGVGTVFKINTNGLFTPLYSFTGGSDGDHPYGRLAQGSGGNFYGSAGGGLDFRGVLFRISTNGALSTLYTFISGHDGANPDAPLVQGSDGNFYGTTYYGGEQGYGVVFRVRADGILARLYSFTGGNDGANPQAGLVQGSNGVLYGTTVYGGTNNNGSVFRITTNGVFTNLYSFTGGYDGANPEASLTQAKDGNFYGTTAAGGTNGGGTLFTITTNGALTSLYSFTGGNDGANPYAGLVQASNGVLYGTTGYGGTNNDGTVFKITTNGAFTSLYSFEGGNDGATPHAVLVQASNGVFYGTTLNGGTNNSGTVFKITANGAYTSLHSFTGGEDGAYPYGDLLPGKNGSFYGTTSSGTTNFAGSVFKITTNGVLTSLYSFTGGNDGTAPQAGLVLGADGLFYGTTYAGGADFVGTVFRITIVPAFKALTLTNHVLTLTWSTESDSRYQLQYNSDVTSVNWSNLGGSVTATGATFTVTDVVGSAARRFYRVALLP